MKINLECDDEFSRQSVGGSSVVGYHWLWRGCEGGKQARQGN
jgi:hypothetical protein